MKTKFTLSLFCSILLAFTVTSVKAQFITQQLVHFWDFNKTLPAGGTGGDSCGTTYSYAHTRANDSANKTITLYADYTKIPGAFPRMIYYRPHAVQTVPLVCTLKDSIVDNGSGGAFYYDFSGYGYNYFNISDSVSGNLFVRGRNPSENSYMYIYASTVGWQNINLYYAITASSVKGAKFNIFQYSVDSGLTWKKLVYPMDTFNVGGHPYYDSLQAINPTTAASIWYPVHINFSSDPTVNNNSKFILRWQMEGTNSNGTSGNDRYDNFAFTGDSNTANIVAYIVRRQNVGPCSGDSNGSARAYVMGGTPPYTFSWSNNCTNSHSAGGLLTDSAFGLKAGTYTLTVTDFNDNAAKAVVTLLQPTQVVPVISSKVNVSCNGSSTGSVNTTTSGGTSPYTYSWNNGRTTANVTGLSAGSYTLTVTDHFGCGGTVSVTLTQPTVINVSMSSSPVTCATPGSATASASGGTPSVSSGYQYSWSSGATTSIANGLGAGSYTVTVTDSLGCSQTASVNVGSTSITVSVSPTSNDLCNGGNNGTIISTVSGGITPYTYNWSNGATTTSISGLTAGSYTLTVTDHVHCTGSGSCLITEPAALKDTIVSITPAYKVIHYWDFNQTPPIGGAGGDSLGTVPNPLPADFTTLHSLNPHLVYTHPITSGILDNGGGPAFAYVNDLHICGNDTASQAINNTFVRDRNPTTNASFIWYIPTTGYQNIMLDWALSASSVKGAQYLIFSYSTNGGVTWNKLTAANDTFTIGSGVRHPDTMLAINSVTKNSLWFPAHVDLSNIAAANNNPNLVFKVNYGGSNITLTSGNDRWDNISVKGQEIPRVSCNGNGNGSAASLVTGGTGPFTYNWSTGSTTDTVNNLVPGTNTVTVTDAHGCSTTASVNVVNPPVLKDSIVVNNGCNNANNGIATSIPSGGTGPYNWNWSNGRVTNIDTNLAPGTYTVTVTDNHGCTVTTTATITNPAVLLANASAIQVTCNGANNGSVSSAPAGGTSPYTYQWSAGAGHSTSATVSGLSPGTDTVKVTDRDGCTSSAIVTITQPVVLTTNISSSSPVACNGGSSGNATANGNGGTSPYSFSWSNGATSATATGLSAGTYTVTTTDNHGCTATVSVNITQPAVLVASILSSSPASCNGGTGSATGGGSGGTSPYSFSWSNGATGATATGLTAGNYTVTTTDNNGCTATAMVTITEPTSLTSNITSSTNVSCNGGNNGSATANAGGGTSPYTFSWSNSATGATANNLTAGGYTVTVTDNNGCVATASVTITEPPVLGVSITSSTPVSCNGGSNGNASANGSGGTSLYSYTWSNSATGASASGLTAGSYTVTVTDNNGCSATASVSITEPPILGVSILSSSPVSCNGGTNGSATAGGSGGTSPYTYNWSNSDVGATASGLSFGTYTVTVSDNNGCSASAAVTITQPTALSTSMNFTQTTCTGNVGTATTNPSGGTPSYAYSWSNGGTTANITGLTAGTYSVLVTDNNACTVTASVLVTAAGGPRDSITNTVNVACFGGNNGSATVGVSGGTPGYTYLWNNGETNATATGLSAGSYTVTVTDAGGCQTSAIDVVGQSSQLRDSVINVVNELCYFAGTGQATVGVTGGTPGYTYSWTSGATSGTAYALTAGSYTVTVTDNKGCSATASVTITQPTQVRDSITSQFMGCIGQNNGNATLAASGGTPGYTYNWSNGATGATVTGLSAGTYTVTVKDTYGCTLYTNITINPDSVPNVKIHLGADSVICDTVKNLTLAPFGSPAGGTFSGPNVSGGIFHPKTAGNGTYTIKYVYTNGGGCTDSATAKIRVDSCKSQGIPTILADGKVVIFPNPSSGLFNISGLTIGSTIEIYDGIGKLITSIKTDRETILFSLEDKANGIYMVRIISKDGTNSVEQKVIKLK